MNKYVNCKDCKEQYDCERTYLGGCTDGKAWEKKLTDEEILKAVECCVEEVAKCTDCPYAEKNRKCIKLSNDVKLLVYRLQDENATLSKVINSSKRKTKILKLQREIERLTEEKQDLIVRRAGLHYSLNKLKQKMDELKAEKETLYIEMSGGQIVKMQLGSWSEMSKIIEQQAVKDTAKEILVMFDDRNYISESELKKAIAERYGVEVEE